VSADNDPISPWAGDSIPDAGPPEITWDHLRPPLVAGPVDHHAPTPPPPFPPPLVISESITSSVPTQPPSSATRRSRALVLVGAATAMTMLIGGSIWLTATDEQPEDSQNADERIDPVTRPAVEPEPAITTATTTTVSETYETLPPTIDDDFEPFPEDPLPIETSVVEQIELPPEVAAIQAPTEVVIQTEGGRLYTLSLPGGELRSVDLTEFDDGDDFSVYGNESLSVSPNGAVVSFGGLLAVIPRIGDAITVDLATVVDDTATGYPFGWIEQSDGSAAFVVVAIPDNGSTEQWFAISGDGTFQPIRGQSIFSTPFAPNGQYVINDAGGSYRVQSDSTVTRMSSGDALAVTSSHLLVRECDEALNCAVVLESIIDGTRTTIGADAAEALHDAYSVLLSPDNSVASFRSARDFELINLLDLTTGEVRSVSSSFYGGSVSPSWAGDSSGLFVTTGEERDGLYLIDGESGTRVLFGEELGIVTAVGVRHPEALLDS
jgi:hypothetical protein